MKNTVLVWVFFVFLLSSCQEECGVIAEPTLSINFWGSINTTKPVFTKISALGMLREIPVAGVAPSTKYGYGDLILPLNLNANFTTYILEQGNKTDTLTIFYQKKLYTPSHTCGTVLDLEAPTNTKLFSSTFKNIEVYYDSYYGISKNFSRTGGGGISITIYLP